MSLLSSVGSSLVFNSVPSTRGSASELDPNPLETGSALLKLREGMGRPRKTLHPPPLCSSGEDRLAKGRLAPAGLHNGRRAPHRTGRKTGGPGAATRWPVPPERGQRVLCIQPDGEGWAPAPPGTLPGSPGLGSPAVTSLSGPLLTDFPVLGWDWVSPSPAGLPELLFDWEHFLPLAPLSAIVNRSGSVSLRERVIWGDRISSEGRGDLRGGRGLCSCRDKNWDRSYGTHQAKIS